MIRVQAAERFGPRFVKRRVNKHTVWQRKLCHRMGKLNGMKMNESCRGRIGDNQHLCAKLTVQMPLANLG